MNKELLQQALEALKDCPFCGCVPNLEDHRTIWAVRCSCGACVLGKRAPEPEEEMPNAYWKEFEISAIDAWNTRTPNKIRAAIEQPERKGLFIDLIAQHEGLAEILEQHEED